MVEWAQQENLEQLVLTDINSTAAGIEFVRLAQEHNIAPVLGVDFRNGNEQLYVALATNNQGFTEINSHLSFHLQNKLDFTPQAPAFNHVVVIYPFSKAPKTKLQPHEFIGLSPLQLGQLRLSPWRSQLQKLVILHSNTFKNKRDFNTHRLLRAINQNALLSKLPIQQQGLATDIYSTPQQLKNAFTEYPQILANTHALLNQCSINFEFKNYLQSQNQQVFTPKGSLADDREKIHRLCQEGLLYRYGAQPPKLVTERLEKELLVLEKRGYYSYFLINWDLVNYARHKNYFYIGRGSGANSLVAYLLRITNVDPIKLDLYFERFINLSRQQPPDFDIDFSWRDRQAITQYIFDRYPKAALLGSHNTFKYKATVRELGKVLGLPTGDIDQLRKRNQLLHQLDDLQQLVVKYGKRIEGFPHNATIHSSGILIPQNSIHQFGATFLPPKGFATTQFDMYSAEDVGLYKFDILGQRGLGKIKDTLQIIKENHPEKEPLNIDNTAPLFEDSKIKALLQKGETMACFYVESPAMRGLLKKLRCDNYITLVAASSIIRPGVAQSGMMAKYIKLYRQPELQQYTHPKLKELLQETYGVMVYQEDVLKVAHFFAGLTMEESDILRRGMSWKFKERNRFNEVREKFFSNCKNKGYPDEVTREVWRQIESFANFAFAKGHSASYAVESYQCLYLKAYYPLAYLVATVNNGGGFYSTETYLNEARKLGATLIAPCINHSQMETVLHGKNVYLGFNLIKTIDTNTLLKIVQCRATIGSFQSLKHFTDSVEISLFNLCILIRINAFYTINPDKKALLWEAHFLIGSNKKTVPISNLFQTESPILKLPPLEHHPLENAVDEIEILGFPLSSPFNLLAQKPPLTHCAKDLSKAIGKQVQVCAYLINVKTTTTRDARAQRMQFGCFVDKQGDFIDTVHWPSSMQRYPFRGKGVYLLKGTVVQEYDFINIDVSYLERLAYVNFENV